MSDVEGWQEALRQRDVAWKRIRELEAALEMVRLDSIADRDLRNRVMGRPFTEEREAK